MAKAIVDYEQQHAAAMEAAWQAAIAKPSDQTLTPSLGSADTMANADKAIEAADGPPTEEKDAEAAQDEEAMETAVGTEDAEQPASGDVAPMAVQPAQGAPMAGQPVLEVAATSVDNPALAGLPPKPRCGQCGSLMTDGRCVYPECNKELDGVAQ